MQRAPILLRALLALLRAQYWHYQNAHWTVKGSSSYGDHLLFQRIYEGLVSEIDTLAEKMVAYFGGQVVDPKDVAVLMQGWLRRWSEVDCLHRRSLLAEQDFQEAAKGVYGQMKAEGSLSLGMDDFLMAMANSHETNTYLVQQTLRGREMASKNASLEDAWKNASLEDAWKQAAPLGGWTSEMTPLEKTWGGFSSFSPIRRGEFDDDTEEGDPNENDDLGLMAEWFKTTDDEGYFRPAPQWSQLQEWAESGEQPELDEKPFSGWTVVK